MAEGLLKNIAGDRVEVMSAGTEPSRVNPFAIRAMEEIGIDISNHKSENVNSYLDKPIDYVVTVCNDAKENCPVFPGAKQSTHKGFRDPSKFRGKDDEILSGFREVRDEIRSWIENEFLCDL